jgi:hypothetical protein
MSLPRQQYNETMTCEAIVRIAQLRVTTLERLAFSEASVPNRGEFGRGQHLCQ